MNKLLIASTQDEITTDPYAVYFRHQKISENVPVTIWTWNLGAGEVIEIQFKTDLTAPNDWVAVGELTADENSITLYAPVQFRLYKQATAGNVGVYMTSIDDRYIQKG